MTRAPLFNRRGGATHELEHDQIRLLVTVGFYPDGAPGEVFTSISPGRGRQTSAFEASTRDAAILISLCLQHGVALETLRKAVTRGDHDEPASVVGAILDSIRKESDDGSDHT
jgi:hypothetical protein